MSLHLETHNRRLQCRPKRQVIGCAKDKEPVGDSPWQRYPRHCCSFQDLISNSRWSCLGSVRLLAKRILSRPCLICTFHIQCQFGGREALPPSRSIPGKVNLFCYKSQGKLSPFSFFAFVESILPFQDVEGDPHAAAKTHFSSR